MCMNTREYLKRFNILQFELFSPHLPHLSVPSRLWNLIQQHIAPQLSILVRDGIMQGVSPDVPEKPVQANLVCCCPSSGYFKHASSHTETSIGGDDLDASNPLSPVAALSRGETGPVVLIFSEDAICLITGLIGKGLSGTEVGKKVAVGLEDVELVGCFFLVLFVGVRAS